MRRGGRGDVLALAGADLDDERMIVAPGPAHVVLIDHERRVDREAPAVRISRQIEQIFRPLLVPRLLQLGGKAAASTHERNDAPIERLDGPGASHGLASLRVLLRCVHWCVHRMASCL